MNDKKTDGEIIDSTDCVTGSDSQCVKVNSDSESTRPKTRVKLRYFNNHNLQDNLYYKIAERVSREPVVDDQKPKAVLITLPIGQQECLSQYDKPKAVKRKRNSNNKHRKNSDSLEGSNLND